MYFIKLAMHLYIIAFCMLKSRSMLHEVTCTADAFKNQMSCFWCRYAVKPEHSAWGTSVIQLNRKVQAEDSGDTLLKGWIMPTLCFFTLFAEWLQTGLLQPFNCKISFQEPSIVTRGKPGSFLRSASASWSSLWSSSLWMVDRLRLDNAGTFMHMLTEHSGSVLGWVFTVINIFPCIPLNVSKLLL